MNNPKYVIYNMIIYNFPDNYAFNVCSTKATENMTDCC